jgi:hypothetical protein
MINDTWLWHSVQILEMGQNMTLLLYKGVLISKQTSMFNVYSVEQPLPVSNELKKIKADNQT